MTGSRCETITYCVHSVVENMRLADGILWSMPITLDVSQERIDALGIKPSARIALRDPRDDQALAILTVDDVYQPNKTKEAINVYGADDVAHPAVNYLHSIANDFYVGGKLEAIQPPSHYDYVSNRCKFKGPLRADTLCFSLVFFSQAKS